MERSCNQNLTRWSRMTNNLELLVCLIIFSSFFSSAFDSTSQVVPLSIVAHLKAMSSEHFKNLEG